MVRAVKLESGFFAQHQVDDLEPGGTPYTHVAERMRGEAESKIRGRAALIGFSGARADTRIEALSGGEKARLLMGLATFDGPQLLILDEPTNHLDIDSRGELIEAINDYEGACIIVSHDRRLLEACVDRLWLVADGTVKPFDGDVADYGRFVLGQGAPSPQKKPAAPHEARSGARPQAGRGTAEARAGGARGQDEPLPGPVAPGRRGAGGSRRDRRATRSSWPSSPAAAAISNARWPPPRRPGWTCRRRPRGRERRWPAPGRPLRTDFSMRPISRA